jgi:hypothetical protein
MTEDKHQADLRPMSEFDPSNPSMVHDQLNDDTFEWLPEKYREHYERYASAFRAGVVEWDGFAVGRLAAII